MKIDRRLFTDLNWSLLFVTLLCTIIGVVNIFSTGVIAPGVEQTPFYLKQLRWAGIAFILLIILISIDYRTIGRYSYLIYVLAIILLAMVDFVGHESRGSQRWLNFFGVSIQPSEFMKIAMVFVLAKYVSDNKQKGGYGFKELIKPLLLLMIPFWLVLKQPDLGTAIMILLIFLSMLIVVGLKKKETIIFSLLSVCAMPFLWFLLKDYQKIRIMTFLDPSRDPFGSGYHITQSIIAAGSGQILGKGFMEGSQTKLQFLPEQHTDFVFSVFAEEWGFLGAILLLLLLLHIILSGIKITYASRDYLGSLLAMGATAIIFWESVINIGMVLGLLPVVGIPLPFMSYGGSSLLVVFICVGVLLSVSMRRFSLQE
ncbi:MAG: rod shape-determining protein RodA [Deltaproteobacteria bacterium]|nr:rod shape-determining protein RodA [Deltaproteobacteria bacterium]